MSKRKRKNNSSFKGGKNCKRMKGVLTVGMKGFLCAYNFRVKNSIREAYHLLNDHAEKKQALAADKLEPELEVLKKVVFEHRVTKGGIGYIHRIDVEGEEKLFQVVNTSQTDKTVFITTTIEDPVEFANEIFSDISTKRKNKSKFLLSMVPIQVTCEAHMDTIKKAADEIFDAPFKCDPLTFNVFYRAKNNAWLKQDEVVSAIETLVEDRNPSHKFNKHSPQKTVIVEVIESICLLSVVTDFYKYKKYNLAEAAMGKSPPVGQKSTVLAVEKASDSTKTASEPKPDEKNDAKPKIEKNEPVSEVETPDNGTT